MVMKMFSLFRAVFLVASLGGLLIPLAQAAEISAPTLPAWTRTMPEPYQGRFSRREMKGNEFFDPQVFFTGENTVLWCELEEYPKLLSTRVPPQIGVSHYMLKVLTMDLRTGMIIAESEVATQGSDRGTLFPALGGLVLRTGETVRFLSKTGDRVVGDVYWSDVRAEPPGLVLAKVSRDGKRILIDYRIGYRAPQPVVECEYDGETFQLLSRHVLSGRESPAIDGDWYWDRLFRPPHSLDTVKGPLHLDRSERMMHVQFSTDHAVGAATVATLHGEHIYWDIYGHFANYRAVAFDAVTGKTFLGISINLKRNEPFAVELSPDGNWLMLLKGRELRVYPVRSNRGGITNYRYLSVYRLL
jgi:hypothetical protein